MNNAFNDSVSLQIVLKYACYLFLSTVIAILENNILRIFNGMISLLRLQRLTVYTLYITSGTCLQVQRRAIPRCVM